MDREHVLRLLDAERRRLTYAGTISEILPAVTCSRALDGSHHAVVFSKLTAEDADAVIEEQVARYRRLKVVFEWKLYGHDMPPDLLDRLARHGFEIGAREAVLIYDLTRAAPWLEAPDRGVVRIERAAQVEVYRRVAEQVFGKDYTFTADELAAALAAGSAQHRGYIAHAGDEPVGIGRLYTHPESVFGLLYGGGTLAEHRRQGWYRAVVAARARDAVASSARYLLVDALPTSLPILTRLGFEHLTDTWPCTRRPSRP